MRNKNPLLVPWLHEMLTAGDVKALQSFCEAGHPAVVAEPIPAHFLEKVFAASRPAGMPCQIANTPPDDFAQSLISRERNESGNPIKWRVAP
jgi:hypothetical protein